MDPDPNPHEPTFGELAATIGFCLLVVLSLAGTCGLSCGLACRVFQIASGT